MKNLHIFAINFLLLIIPIKTITIEKKADLIIFSYDRPLQLHTLLSSIEKYVTNLNKIFVIYRVSNQDFQIAYEQVRSYFKDVEFISQGAEPKKDFKPLLLNCFYRNATSHILFATDDDIFKDYVDISSCIQALEKTNAYGFYLRLGTNIINSYMHNLPLILPSFFNIATDIISFSFQEGKSYWAYPNNFDMTLYNKSVIEDALVKLSYYSPNILESRWARLYQAEGCGACFTFSKGINIPLNLVQDDWHNKHEEIFTAQELLNLWNEGYTIDISSFHKVNNSSAHMAYVPTFIKRDTYDI